MFDVDLRLSLTPGKLHSAVKYEDTKMHRLFFYIDFLAIRKSTSGDLFSVILVMSSGSSSPG